MISRRIFLTVSLFFAFLSIESASADTSLNIRTELEYWKTNLGGPTTSILSSIGIALYQESYAYGLNLSTVSVPVSSNDVFSATQSGYDISVGKTITNSLSLLVGYQLIRTGFIQKQDNSRSFDEYTHGPSLSFVASNRLRHRALLYLSASAGYLFTESIFSGQRSSANGQGINYSFEVGYLQQLSSSFDFNVFTNYQTMILKYESGGTWTPNQLSTGATLIYSF